MKTLLTLLFLTMLAVAPAAAQQTQVPQATRDFGSAAQSAQQRLEDSLKELAALREQAANETIPLSRRLSELESELSDVRLEFQQTSRMLDSRTLDLSNLRSEIQRRKEESTYLSNLLGEYIRNFESRLHIAELQRYEEALDEARLAPENDALSEQDVYEKQAALLTLSVDRLEDALGGTTFEGSAVDEAGIVNPGTFLLVGPAALFASQDGQIVGTAEQRLGSLEPTVATFQDPADSVAARAVIADAKGAFPFDPTLGNAHKIEDTEETFAEHVAKGGPVMIPIFILAGLSLLVALCKWISFLAIRAPERSQVRELLGYVSRQDRYGAKEVAAQMKKRRPDFKRDWVMGLLIGLFFGLGVWAFLSLDVARSIAPGLAPLAEQFGPAIFVAFFGIIGAGLQFLLRLVFGYSPTAEMLSDGVEHLEYPPELIEEVMYERILAVRLHLEGWLPFIAICAAAAPLLGLLGTVTGIINTFKLITVFGSGDVKTLSSGISEALVTTEFGLITAIPALLLHGLLVRKARGIVNRMETAGVSLVNTVSKSPMNLTAVAKKMAANDDMRITPGSRLNVPKQEVDRERESDEELAASSV
ncbi:MAG: MotA/TolQ/ExbB proton channel family protein [Sumerlaeia bacterium]